MVSEKERGGRKRVKQGGTEELKSHREAEHSREKVSTGKTQVHEEQTAQAITSRRKFKLAFSSFRFLYPVAIL